MTPALFGGVGVHHFYCLEMLFVACKYLTQSKYINETETKQQQRPMNCGTDQVLQHFAIKMGFCKHCLSVID